MGSRPGLLFRKSATPAAGTFQPIRNRVWSGAIATGSMEHKHLVEAGDGASDVLTTWAPGQSVIANSSLRRYNGKHYHCNTSHTTGATFAADASKWDELRPLSYFAGLACDPTKKSAGKTGADVWDTLKAANPAIQLHAYVYAVGASNTDTDSWGIPAKAWLDTNSGWLYSVAGTGHGGTNQVTPTRTQGGVNNPRTVNITAYGPRDANGRSWAEWNAYAHTTTAPWDTRPWHWFVDDVMPQVDRDTGNGDYFNYNYNSNDLGTGYWDLTTSLASNNAGAEALWREGIRKFFEALRAARPGTRVDANVGGLLPVEWRRAGADRYFMEGVVGETYSMESQYPNGWHQQLILEAKLHAAYGLDRRAPSRISVRKFTDDISPTTLPTHENLRFGLASALLTDGVMSYRHSTAHATAYTRFWFAEYDVELGVPVEPMPTAPWANGVWKREYQNGLVLVNPRLTHAAGWDSSANDKTVSLPAGTWRRLTGTLDAADDGSLLPAGSTVSLPVRTGLILLRA